MKTSVVISVFNDADALAEMLLRLSVVALEQGYEMQVVVVDDGSDETVWQLEKALIREVVSISVTLMRLSKNYGQHLATMQGMLISKGEIIITMDSDLQHPPEFIPDMLNKLQRDSLDLLYARSRGAHGFGRRLISAARRILVAPIGTSLPNATSFRAIRRVVFEKSVRKKIDQIYNIDEFFSWIIPNAQSMPAPHNPRKYRSSSYTAFRLLSYAARSAWYSRHLPRAMVILGVALLAGSIFSEQFYSTDASQWVELLLFLSGIFSIALAFFVRLSWLALKPGRDVNVIEVVTNAI